MKLSQNITTEELMKIDYHYHYTENELVCDWHKLLNTTVYKTGAQFRPGIKLCQHFCPNFFDIQNSSGKSFSECWGDYELMNSVREWGLKSMSNLWLSWIRRAVYMRAGLPNSSYYRPHFSKQIIEMTGKSNGTLLDPCIGWGGRMLGTIAAGWDYFGCDPNQETFANVSSMLEFVQSNHNTLFNPSVTLVNDAAENCSFPNQVDIVLTSPPYFDLEVYTDDSLQSYRKYGAYDQWRDQWLLPLIDSGFDSLSDDGLSCWNVMNTSTAKLADDVFNHHIKNGYTLVDTVGFNSPLANMRTIRNKDVTYIFKRSN